MRMRIGGSIRLTSLARRRCPGRVPESRLPLLPLVAEARLPLLAGESRGRLLPRKAGHPWLAGHSWLARLAWLARLPRTRGAGPASEARDPRRRRKPWKRALLRLARDRRHGSDALLHPPDEEPVLVLFLSQHPVERFLRAPARDPDDSTQARVRSAAAQARLEAPGRPSPQRDLCKPCGGTSARRALRRLEGRPRDTSSGSARWPACIDSPER